MLDNLTEVLPWVHQLKSHVQTTASHNLQTTSLDLSSLILLGYLVLIATKFTVSRAIALLAVSLCIMISYSPLYSILTEYEYHLMFALIYAMASIRIAKKRGGGSTGVAQKKIAIGCCIMCLFNIYMAIDATRYANIQTWSYINYEYITCFIHVFIILAGVKLGLAKWKDRLASIVNSLRVRIHSASCYCYS